MTTAPTLETFYNIVRQAVIDMDYLPGVQINTFALVDQSPDLMGQSFGYEFNDYLNGFFWSRRWVLGDASPNTICGEYPALFIELTGSDVEDGTHEISIVLVDKIECETCPPEVVRTGPAVESNLRRAARALLLEIESYILYDVGDAYQWASPGRALAWETPPVDEPDDIENYMDVTKTRIRKWGDYPGLRGVALNLGLSTCEVATAPFRYDTPIEPLAGATNCGC